MKTKSKFRVISGILATMTTLSILAAGCGNQQNPTGKQSTSDKQSASDNQNSSGGSNNTQKGSSEKTETIHKLKLIGAHNGGNAWEKRDTLDAWKEWEKMRKENNLELEYELVTSEQYPTVIQTRMSAGNDLPDIANVSPLDDTMLLNFAKQGIILELNALLDQYSNGNVKKMYEETYPFANGLVLTQDGKRNWTTNLYVKSYKTTELANTGLAIMVRGDWLDALKLPTPKTLYEFKSVLQAFRDQDANGTGKADEIYNLNVQTFQNGLAQCFGLGADVVSIDPNAKKAVSPWYQEGIKAYFAYVQDLVNSGLVDPALIGSGEVANQRTADNMVGAFFSYGMDGWTQKKIANVENAHFQPLMPLTGAGANITPYAVVEPGQLCWNRYVVTKGCKDVEGAVKLLDLFYSEEYRDMMCWGMEGASWEIKDGLKSRITYEGGNDEKFQKGIANGEYIFGDYIPNLRYAYLEQELDSNATTKPKPVAYQKEVNSYKNWYTNMNGNYLAIATDAESEEMGKIATAINTYSQELCTKLCLGQESLDNMDKFIAEFDKMGLKRLIEIYQGRLDRYYSIGK